MEAYHIPIKNNVTSQKKLWDLQQGITSNSRSFDIIETISTRHYRKIWSLDVSQKPQVFSRTTQVKWTTDKMVFEVIRLWLHTTIYSGKDKHKSRCTVKKKPSGYERGQQRRQIAQRQVMDKNHRSRGGCNPKKSSSRRNYTIGRNQEKPNERTESPKEIGKGQRPGMGRQLNSLHGWEDLCSK